MDVEEALDRLYAAPLGEFTVVRNTLAKELGPQGGDLKALKKPNVAAWAVNQLVRAHPDEIEELFDVTDKLRRAQRRVLSGGKAADLRQATDERNKVVGRLAKLAERVLKDAGHGASAATLSAVGDSLVAVASDDTGAELLRKGRLTRELEPGSVLDVGGLALVPRGDEEEESEARGEPRADRERLTELRRERDDARAALKLARAQLKAAHNDAARRERESDEAARAAKAAKEKADFAKRAEDARRKEVESAEAVVEETEAAIREIERKR